MNLHETIIEIHIYMSTHKDCFSSNFSNEKSREYQRWRASGQLAPDSLTGQSFSRGAQERISSISVFIGVCGHPFKLKL